jgi:hypothetical protein
MPNDPADPYAGSFTMASEYRPTRYDIFSIRAIVHRLGKADQIEALNQRLYAMAGDEFPDD